MLKQIINQDPGNSGRGGVPATSPPQVSPATAQPQQHTTSASLMSASKNILSNDVEITGNLKFSHDLIIDGKIEGEVTSDGNLTVGENARVKGEIKTKSVTVFGKVEGNITVTDRCELKANAELIGDIRAGTLAIEEGAAFMGASTVGAHAASKSASAGTGPSAAPSISAPVGGGIGMPKPATPPVKAPFGSA